MIRSEIEYQAAVERLLELVPESEEFKELDREIVLYERRQNHVSKTDLKNLFVEPPKISLKKE